MVRDKRDLEVGVTNRFKRDVISNGAAWFERDLVVERLEGR